MTYAPPQQWPEEGGYLDSAVELHLVQVQERLLALRKQLEFDDLFTDGPDDPASGEQAVVFAVQFANEQKLAQVRAALASIKDGTYGTCTDCTQPIGRARLAARPFAIRCVACQQLADRQGSQGQGWSIPPSQWLAN
jgi:RNA polymerase-binding transcription factor DksA